MQQHLILYDDSCSFCKSAIDKVICWDKKKIFRCLPLDSPLAKAYPLKNIDSLILIEKFQTPKPRTWIRGRAIMRILWLLGGWRKLIGWQAYFPLGVDFAYRLIARYRHHLSHHKH